MPNGEPDEDTITLPARLLKELANSKGHRLEVWESGISGWTLALHRGERRHHAVGECHEMPGPELGDAIRSFLAGDYSQFQTPRSRKKSRFTILWQIIWFLMMMLIPVGFAWLVAFFLSIMMK